MFNAFVAILLSLQFLQFHRLDIQIIAPLTLQVICFIFPIFPQTPLYSYLLEPSAHAQHISGNARAFTIAVDLTTRCQQNVFLKLEQ